MVRDDQRDVHWDVPKEGFAGRIEVLTGATGRRRWPDEVKARIVAESYAPGGRVADIARLHGTTRWQVYHWRKKLQTGQLVVPESVAALPMFAELVVEGAAAEAPPATEATGVEIVIGDVVIRAGAGADEGLLTRTIRAARAAAS